MGEPHGQRPRDKSGWWSAEERTGPVALGSKMSR